MKASEYTLIDLDFLIRLAENGTTDRLISARGLQEYLDKISPDFFDRFVKRAYREMKDEYTCKLRRGDRITFVLR